jgi:hypothetical protein
MRTSYYGDGRDEVKVADDIHLGRVLDKRMCLRAKV